MKNKNQENEIDINDLTAPEVAGESDQTVKNKQEKNKAGTDEDMSEFVELGEDGEEMSGKDQTKKLREKIKKLENEKQEYLNSWQRALADYKNREMQIEKEKKEWGGYAVKRFAEELLVVMDTYDAAKSNKEAWEKVDHNWRVGIEYIFMTFESKLAEQGFEKFGKVGDVFNPEIHEGLGIVDVTEGRDDDKNKISQLIMSGYNYKGQLFRAAKVKVWG